jgi:hypothetical protein
MLCYSIDFGFLTIVFLTGLEEAMEFLEEAFPDVEIAVAHGKVFTPFMSLFLCRMSHCD